VKTEADSDSEKLLCNTQTTIYKVQETEIFFRSPQSGTPSFSSNPRLQNTKLEC